MIVCAGRKETFEFAKIIGVGLIESAINLTEICLENKPKNILFIGTAGSYGEYNIFDIIESRSAANIELSFLRKDSYTPLNTLIESQNKIVKNDTIVNSSNYISTNKNLTATFLEEGIGIENMEFFAVLEVAKKFNIPAAGIFIVSNYTNKDAHKTFLKNHHLAMSKLSSYVLNKDLI
ncbi:MAG: purine-nucleoside phosphorylase [Campylobacteraceae bacterium]|nr:purine-nucleoside phosphorylase [Campylobacteraceae bacterium]